MANKHAQHLADSILSLYDVAVDSDETIARHYLPEAVFTDPVVAVRGVENIQAQFRALSKFVRSSKATLVRGSMAGSSVLTIDSSVVFRLKPFPSLLKIQLRMFSVLELRGGKIASHTDHFDFYSVLNNIPVVSYLYAQFRPMFGAASSAVIKRLVPSSTSTKYLTEEAESNGNGVQQATATS